MVLGYQSGLYKQNYRNNGRNSMKEKKISLNYTLTILSLLYIIISDVFINYLGINSPIFQYSDEIISIFSAFCICLICIKHKFIISKNDSKILKILIVVIGIGILSNIFGKMSDNIYSIFVDILSFSKIFIVFIGFKLLLGKESSKRALKKFVIPSKIFLFIAFVCGFISLFKDIGMSGNLRFGIRGYRFIFGYEHLFSVYLLVSYLSILMSKEKTNIIYTIFFISCSILTTKGPSIIIAFLTPFLFWYFKKNDKISFKVVVLIGLSCFILGSFQIDRYLSNTNAPRHLFYKYSLITAKDFFPLGSGFATYGSDMAYKNYSPLYYKYGFNIRHGMMKDRGQFLNDNYWPMVLGQFGYGGCLLLIYIMYIIVKEIQLIKNRKIKTMLLIIYLYFIIHSIGSSILTSSSGVFGFIFMAIAMNLDKEEKNEKNN